MKRIFAVISGAVMLLPFFSPDKAGAINFPLKDQIRSESAVVINLDSDMVIHDKNASSQQMPGPLVNIMTAIICMENCDDLNEAITIDESVYADFYSWEYPDDLRYADIMDGDVLTVEDLLHAMMLTSSIEAAETLAYHFSDGDIDSFVEKMNDKAAEIGCQATHFTNPTGMYDINQYTTAYDVAAITEYALEIPRFDSIATEAEYVPSNPNVQNHSNVTEWVWKNSNLMMDSQSDYYYNGTKGIKTGNLTAAGRNLVTLASKDGNNYLVVLLKAPINDTEGNTQFYHIEDAISVLNWAFNHFSYQVILSETAEVDEVKVTLAEGNDYVLARPKEEFSMLWYDELDTSLIKRDGDNIKFDRTSFQAPIKKGDRLGEVTLTYSGETLGKVELVAVSNVKRSASKYNLYVAKRFKESKWFNKAVLTASLLCGIYILICILSFIAYKNDTKPATSRYAIPKLKKKKKSKKKDD